MKKSFFTIMALIIIIGLSACGGANEPQSESVVTTNEENAEQLTFVATNWQFDKEEYHIPVNQPINFMLVNQEGYHGIAFEGLGVSLEGGEDHVKQFKITEPGTYEIRCNIICGTGHSDMRAKLIVE